MIRRQPSSIAFIENPTEEMQIEAVKNIKNYNTFSEGIIVGMSLKSNKARELYNKLKIVNKIIK
jgi:hypothetical protein